MRPIRPTLDPSDLRAGYPEFIELFIGFRIRRDSRIHHRLSILTGNCCSTYTTLGGPTGAVQAFAEGIDGSNIVGYYIDSAGATHGFLFNGSAYTILNDPSAVIANIGINGTRAFGISGNNIVGVYSDSVGDTQGFLYNGSTFTTITDPAGPTWTEPMGISGNTVVGFFATNTLSGFIMEASSGTSIPPTVATAPANSISATGATLNAAVNPEGSTATAYFQYSTDSAFTPTVETTIGSGYDEPFGAAVDAAGDVFVAHNNNNAVKEILPDGTTKSLGSGFANPNGVAVDAAGDVFVADNGNNAVKEILPNGTVKTIGSGFFLPQGVAVDAAGDVFVADRSSDAIKEVLPNGAVQTIGSGFSAPYGVAVDASGDVFVADTFNNEVKEVLPGGAVQTIGSGFNEPTSVTLDAAGDVFVADYGDNAIRGILPSGVINAIGSGFSGPHSVALDAVGDVFVADTFNNRVVELSPLSVPAAPSALSGSFATAVSAMLTGLTPGTTYYYRAVASSAGGTVADSTNPPESFTTPTITWATPADMTYGTPLGATQLDASASIGGSFTYTLADGTTPAAGAVLHAGQNQVLNVTFTPTDSTDYATDTAEVEINVDPTPLTITADDKSTVYGATLPALTATYSGFVNGDNAASLTRPPTLATTATAASHVSRNPYTITASGAVDGDYTISYVAGSLTVTPAALTITSDDKSKVYGAALPTLTASYSGFVNGDTSTSLATAPTLATTATASSHVSGSPYTITASGAVDADYTISYVAGALTITPAPLTITADDKTKVYGAPLPALTASYTGFVNGDSSAGLATQPALSTTATAGSHVSGNPYAITADGAIDADYTISYVSGALIVTPAPLTITADDQSKIYGAALPALTASYSGFVNGDDSASLTTQPTLTTAATVASHIFGSPYAITASGAADPDYTISYVSGSLTVTPAPLTITADDQSKIYGAALPALTASYSGFVNGDGSGNLTTQPTLATTATAASDVPGSPYAITASGAADSDYTISYVPGALTVTPATLTVKANDASRSFGAANPTFTDTITGFVNGDDASVVSGEASLSTTATATSGVGEYPITPSAGTLSAADYSFGFQSGTLAVTTNLQGDFGLVEDIYTIGSGTVSVSAANGVLANDSGPGQLTVTAGRLTGAEGGTFAFNADGSFTYTPPTDFPGFDDAEYTATDAAGDRASATVNVLSQTGGVVWKFYESVLGRDPDSGGLKFWINDFVHGGKTGDIAVGFFESPELLNKVIGGYYEQYLLRSADAAGLAHWESVWGEDGGPEKIRAFFAESEEFYTSAGGTPDAWINALYQRILARSPDPQGEQFWLKSYQQQVAAGGDAAAVRFNIALAFLTSQEDFGDDVTGWFNEYLLRAPTDAERQQYTNEMLAGASDRQIEQEITNLPEYGQNPPAAPDGAATRLADYYQQTSPSGQQQASIAAKDALFARLGG
jgi:hypothetical protein